MSYERIIKKESKPYMESLRDDMKARRNKEFFWATGTQVYCGRQGSGKTISAVKHVMDIKNKYPKAIIVSNLNLNYLEAIDVKDVDLSDYPEKMDTAAQYLFFSSIEDLSRVLTQVNNEFYGVVYLIDEIHTYFNALGSLNVPMYVFTEISQQRKQRKLIIGTSQLFLRLAKPFREQCDSLIICNTRFGVITFQKAYDGMTLEQDYDGSISGDLKRRGWFFQNRKIRGAFDTYQKVVSGSEQYEDQKKIEIVQKRKTFGF